MEKIRILILLSVLLVVAVNAWRDQNQNWDRPVLVLLHPVNADGQAITEQYIRQLNIENFKDSQNFLAETSAAYRGKKS